ncbi:hypothetical protein HK104_001189, partial [Borealophlyctis nickersoniae]
NDATLGLAGNYAAKSGSAIAVIGNLIGENITASSGVTRVGNEIRGSYSGVGMIYVSGSSIGIREADLDQKIADKTGISQPQSGGGAVGGIFGGLTGGLVAGSASSAPGLTSSGILSGVAAGISAGGAAVSIGANLSHGLTYGSGGLSLGNLEGNEGAWGYSFGSANLLYPSIYSDKLKSVAALSYLVGSGNTTIVDSDSLTTGTLCVLGSVGIYNNLHVGQAIYAQGFKCRRGVNASFHGNTFNLYWSGEVEIWIDVTHVGSVALKDWVQGNFMPITYQPDLSNFYSRDEINTLVSPLASREYVYYRVEAGQTFPTFSYVQQYYKPIEYEPDLSSYYSRDEVNSLISQFAPLEHVYTKATANQRFKPIDYAPDLSPYALKTDLEDYHPNSLHKSINWQPDLSPYLLSSTANTLYKSIDWEPNLSAYALKSDLATLGSYWTKTESDGRFLRVGSPIIFPTDVSHDSSDGKHRFYFGNNARTYNYSRDGYEWRNAADTSSLLILDNGANLSTGNIALQYNTLFLGLVEDTNHYISHGMASLAATSYGIDGVVVQGGVGGGALGQSGTTALRWLNNVVSIPGSLQVSGSVNIAEVSIPPKNLSDTRPAFEIQVYMHDNVNILFDTA